MTDPDSWKSRAPGGAGAARAKDISARLASRAEEVCRVYLSNGRRTGNYWQVGDVENAKGRSLWVRLGGAGQHIGRWRDEAEPDRHGDLLDLIRFNGGYARLSDAMKEAERFLGLPPVQVQHGQSFGRPQRDAVKAAQRLFGRGEALAGTFGAAYLASRALSAPPFHAVRFLADAMFIGDDGVRREHPALLAAIRDQDRAVTGVHRTFIGKDAAGPHVLARRILGRAKGNAVCLGGAGGAALVGEGIETALSLAAMLDGVRLYAALSAAKLAAWRWPQDIGRIIVAVDNDANGAGEHAARRLMARAAAASLPATALFPRRGDFNDDLRADGFQALRQRIIDQTAHVLR